MSSDEKLQLVLEQYDIDIKHTYKFGGAIFLESASGLFMLRQKKVSESRIFFEEELKNTMLKSGFSNLDFCQKTKNDKYVAEGIYGETYTLRKWYEGNECELTEQAHVINAARVLGVIHNTMKGCFPTLPDLDKKEKKLPEGTLAAREAEEAENCSQMSADQILSDLIQEADINTRKVSNSVPDSNANSTSDAIRASNISNLSVSKSASDKCYIAGDINSLNIDEVIIPVNDYHKWSDCPYVQPPVNEIFSKRIREMKRIITYLNKQKQPGNFESFLLKQLPIYIGKSTEAASILDSSFDKSLVEEAKVNGSFFHGSYTGHNIINTGNLSGISPLSNRFSTIYSTYVVNFEKAKIGPKVYDFYHFLRKLGEKNNWDYEFIMPCIDAYLEIATLDEREINVFMAMLHFPEKFWKIVNMYFNGKKNWIPGKVEEKIEGECERLKLKEDFEKKLGVYK
jgi:hypothetical protein